LDGWDIFLKPGENLGGKQIGEQFIPILGGLIPLYRISPVGEIVKTPG